MQSSSPTHRFARALSALSVVAFTVLAGTAGTARAEGLSAAISLPASASELADSARAALRAHLASRPRETVTAGVQSPISEVARYVKQGMASWYGSKFHGRRTASGEKFDMHAMSAAHPTLPLFSWVRVRNPANQREVLVRINDRGPFHGNRILDLSAMAASKLGIGGVGHVEIEQVADPESAEGLAEAREAREAAALATLAAAKPVAPEARVIDSVRLSDSDRSTRRAAGDFDGITTALSLYGKEFKDVAAAADRTASATARLPEWLRPPITSTDRR